MPGTSSDTLIAQSPRGYEVSLSPVEDAGLELGAAALPMITVVMPEIVKLIELGCEEVKIRYEKSGSFAVSAVMQHEGSQVEIELIASRGEE